MIWLKKLKASITKNNTSKIFSAAIALLVLLTFILLIARIIDNSSPIPITKTDEVKTAEIKITKNGFVPANLLVAKGTKVTWTNSDKTNHQLQANPHPTGESLPGLKSEILHNQQTYTYTTDTLGTFSYHDHLNPTTNGIIEVKE
jgi:plastocyanin